MNAEKFVEELMEKVKEKNYQDLSNALNAPRKAIHSYESF
jgi:hypothetical protein